ncbi:MAG TPA: ATP synthase subunit I [Pyrinomonadaceae bacterium]|nr:ATP synthase subunit I [Pyrinomonadaceae bacterium]
MSARLPAGPNDPTNRRIFRNMCAVVIASVCFSLPFMAWRVSAGLLIGGALSLLNHYWLTRSSAAAFSVIAHGERPRLSLFQYILRYAVIAIVIVTVYNFNLASVVAIAAGLSSFVAALFIEAGREFYFAIIRREETI